MCKCIELTSLRERYILKKRENLFLKIVPGRYLQAENVEILVSFFLFSTAFPAIYGGEEFVYWT